VKVIYDCTVLDKWTGHATGIQRVVEELGRELVRCMPAAVLGVFDKDGVCRAYSLDDRQTGSPIQVGRDDLIFSAGHDWDYLDHFDVIQTHIARGVRFAILCHDTIPLKFPFTYSAEFVSRFEFWLKKSLQTVGLVFSNSESTRADVTAYAKQNNLRAPEIRVLRLGDHLPMANSVETPSPEIVRKAQLPFVLSVGTLEFRKNHRVLLDAYRFMLEDMKFKPPKLYIVGKQGELDGGIRRQAEGDLRLQGFVEVLHGVADADLHVLYQSALFTVYPSIYEGWGLPVAESLYYGKPCIASRCSSMREIAPDFIRFAHPLKVEDWVRNIVELANHPETRLDESERISKGYSPIPWANTAEQARDVMVDLWPEIMGGEGS